MKEKIAYIGHSYHKKTKSTKFLLDYLKEFYDVEIFWDESWKDHSFVDYSFLTNDKYKAVILFHVFKNKKTLKSLKHENIIFIPMFESVRAWRFRDWFEYKDMKILSFCKAIYLKLKKIGFNVEYLQYFPQPKNFELKNENTVFFWQRQSKININTLKKIFKNQKVDKLHIHKAIDPTKTYLAPSVDDEEKYAITYSEWFETKEEMQEVIAKYSIYIAPRLEEGIGMSFLEAMAMGKVVIAHNQHTMNEYIKNNETGYLVDFKNPKPLDAINVEEISKQTYKFIQEGYKNYLQKRSIIIEMINSPVKKIQFPLWKKLFLAKLCIKKTDIIKLKFGKKGYLSLFGVEIIKKKLTN